MTAANETAARAADFERRCRQQGLTLTVQRRAVFAALAPRRDHPTADQVYEAVRRRVAGISRTTVYRVLETLVRAGIITKACHPGAAARYDPRRQRHDHLVCLRCDKVVDFDAGLGATLSAPRNRPRGFEIHEVCVHYRGLCPDCRTRSSSPVPSTRGRGAVSRSVVRKGRKAHGKPRRRAMP
ncbi:MAG TPA: transcriptional repressor [Phycisphaerae bacterium]|nr:transcriptional repressor [Phycisphaerae bacterium]HNU45756.1 transcriptional repressor [Phycisphaerae bacterium]